MVLAGLVLVGSFAHAAETVVFQVPDRAAAGKNLLADWAPYEAGYELDRGRTGRCIRVTAPSGDHQGGARTVLTLNQKRAAPLLVTGWSKAQGVSGGPSSGYSLYVDLTYTDGTPLWGSQVRFSTGTHDWERRSFVVLPEKPIRSLSLYCLFRGHAGTVWFDDIACALLPEGPGSFDGVTVLKKAPITEGLLLRDHARENRFVRVTPGKPVGDVTVKVEEAARGGVRFFTARVTTTAEAPKLLTLYGVVPIDAVGGAFHRDILRSDTIDGRTSYADVVPVSAGATGTITRYPLVAVTPRGAEWSQVLAVPMDQPVVTRLAYQAGTKALTVAFDFALDRRVHRFPGTITLKWATYRVPAPWGFRAAYRRYQELFAASFVKRVPTEGVWMPFYDIAKVEGAADFGFGFKEGTNNVAYDEAHGVLTFRYVEPQSHWLRMPNDAPRTNEGVLKALSQRIGAGDKRALATLSSGIWDQSGSYSFSIRNTPWCNGAVFVLNPDPALGAATTKARQNYDPRLASGQYAQGLDGEYLDSLEGWNDTLNFRDEHLEESSVPLTFDRATKKPCLLTAFSVYAYTRYVAGHVHRRGRLLMANSTPHRFGFLCHFLDLAGTETNWKRGGTFSFDPAVRMAYRRAFMGSKPYVFLQNTSWEGWTKDDSENFMKWCLHWGMYPGFFSPDASSRHYFSTPERYNRDRDLFKRYVPLVRRVSQAGWQPVTLARAGVADVFVERWGRPEEGTCYLTVFNSGKKPQQVSLRLEGELARQSKARDLLSNRTISVAVTKPGEAFLKVAVEARGIAVLKCERAP